MVEGNNVTLPSDLPSYDVFQDGIELAFAVILCIFYPSVLLLAFIETRKKVGSSFRLVLPLLNFIAAAIAFAIFFYALRGGAGVPCMVYALIQAFYISFQILLYCQRLRICYMFEEKNKGGALRIKIFMFTLLLCYFAYSISSFFANRTSCRLVDNPLWMEIINGVIIFVSFVLIIEGVNGLVRLRRLSKRIIESANGEVSNRFRRAIALFILMLISFGLLTFLGSINFILDTFGLNEKLLNAAKYMTIIDTTVSMILGLVLLLNVVRAPKPPVERDTGTENGSQQSSQYLDDSSIFGKEGIGKKVKEDEGEEKRREETANLANIPLEVKQTDISLEVKQSCELELSNF